MSTPPVTADGVTVNDTMTMMTGMTTAATATSGSSSSGSINVAPTTAIPTSIVARPARGGPIAFLEDRAAMLSQRADEAAAFARAAVTDAQDFTNAHASILAKHRKMFLMLTGFLDLTLLTLGARRPGRNRSTLGWIT